VSLILPHATNLSDFDSCRSIGTNAL
jgi:hypothetical protein